MKTICVVHQVVLHSILSIYTSCQTGSIGIDTPGFSELRKVVQENGILGTLQNFPLPPQFMIELYQRHAKEDELVDEPAVKVRCILGKVKWETVVFNLTSLSGESLSRVEMHLYKKKSERKANKRLPRMTFFVSNSPSSSRRARGAKKMLTGDSIRLPIGRGWKKIDMTKIIKKKYRTWDTLTVTLERLISRFGNGPEAYHGFPIDEYIRLSYKPFLVIFSLMPIPANNEQSTNDILTNSSQSSSREWDSILKNVLSQDTNEVNDINREGSRTLVKRSAEGDLDSHILPLQFPPRRRLEKVKLQKRYKKPTLFKPIHQGHLMSINSIPTTPLLDKCHLQDRYVTFNDFDWGEAILAPATAQVSICTGACSQVNLSQNLVGSTFSEDCNELQHNGRKQNRKHVKGCCRPSSFRRLSVLYVDSFQTIVLQSFGNLSARECSC